MVLTCPRQAHGVAEVHIGLKLPNYETFMYCCALSVWGIPTSLERVLRLEHSRRDVSRELAFRPIHETKGAHASQGKPDYLPTPIYLPEDRQENSKWRMHIYAAACSCERK